MITTGRSPTEALEQQMENLVKQLELSPKDMETRERIRADLEQYLKMIFPNCAVHLYGSSVNTFGNRESDVDAFLDLQLVPDRILGSKENRFTRDVQSLLKNPCTTAETKLLSETEILPLVTELFKYFETRSRIKVVASIANASTPILKLKDTENNISIDISFSHKLVLQNTGLLIVYSQMDKRVRPLVFAIRKWAVVNDLCLTNYALTLLVIFFLRQVEPKVVLSPKEIMLMHQQSSNFPFNNQKGSHILYSPLCYSSDSSLPEMKAIASKLPISKNTEGPGKLLHQFFSYYSKFAFHNYVLDCFNGSMIPKAQMPEKEFILAWVNIQDPFDRTKNISKNVDHNDYLRLKKTIELANQILLSSLHDLDDLFKKPVVLAPAWLPFTKSIDIQGPKMSAYLRDQPNLPKILLRDFLSCQILDMTSQEEKEYIDRELLKLGALNKFRCRIECRSWDKSTRRRERRGIYGGKGLVPRSAVLSPSAEYQQETEVGNRIHQATKATIKIDLYVSITHQITNYGKYPHVISFSFKERTAEIEEFFESMRKYLPGWIGRFHRVIAAQ